MVTIVVSHNYLGHGAYCMYIHYQLGQNAERFFTVHKSKNFWPSILSWICYIKCTAGEKQDVKDTLYLFG